MQLQFLILTICVSATLARPSPPGKNYNPHRVKVSGHRAISLLGTFNGKHIYFGSELVSQDVARSDCIAAGFKLGTFNQGELNYIFTVTTFNEDYAWTSATHHFGHSAFKFEDGSTIPTDIQLNDQTDYAPGYGVVIDRFAEKTHLKIVQNNQLQGYLCYIEA